jgi:hypothetical protein
VKQRRADGQSGRRWCRRSARRGGGHRVRGSERGGKVRGKECVGKEKADNGGMPDLGSGDLEMDLGEKLVFFRSVVSGG